MRSLFVVVAVAVLVIPLAVHGQQGGVDGRRVGCEA